MRKTDMYDIIIIGGGPAGLTAALYACRANKSVLVIEKETFGGQITFSPKVENIPGFPVLSGNEFAEKLVDQVLSQGADVESCEVTAIRDGEIKTVVTDDGEFQSRAVIIATGAKHRRLGLPGEDELIGEGISFCAVCDGAFYEGKTVGVVGGGNSALQEALLLSDLAAHVHVIQNLPFLTGEGKLQEQLAEKKNVTVHLGYVVSAYESDASGLTGVRLQAENRESTSLTLDGIFLAVGLVPQNEPFSDLISLDKNGYVDSDESCTTGVPGVFTAGDCRRKTVRQVTTAAADGAIAALAACRYIDAL